MPASSPKSDFTGKKVLVTGAGRGIGKAVAIELYAQGATIFALSKNPDNLKSLKKECPNMQTICVDLSDWEETRKILENNVDSVDVLINNAAIHEPNDFMNIKPESFDKLFNVNLKSVINVSQVIGKKMIDRGEGGSIVNISSVAGLKPFAGAAIYCCTKAALEMLTKIMAIEFGHHKITVNSICPAAVQTDMLKQAMTGFKTGTKDNSDPEELLKMLLERTPTKTVFMPMSDVVNAILFFASGSTSQITGSSIAVDGGMISN